MALSYHTGGYSFVTPSFALAAAATDVLVIVPQIGRYVSVRKIAISGIATANTFTPVHAILRSSLNSGGTAVQITGAPRVMFNLTSPTTPISPSVQAFYYTANPTTGSTYAVVDSAYIMLSAAASSVPSGPLVFDWSSSPVILQGTATPIELVVNFGGATVAGAAVIISVELKEE